MRLVPLLVLVPLLAAPSARAATAEESYLALRHDLFALEKDGRRNRYRDAWTSVQRRLDRFARAHRTKERACDARFLAAQAHAGMAAVSHLAKDRRDAADRYREVARACPGSRLADDALFRAAEISSRGDAGQARADLSRLLERHAGGDHAPLARRLLAQLPAERVAAAPARKAKGRGVQAAHGAGRSVAPSPRRDAPLDVQALAHPAGGALPLSVVAGLKVKRVVIDPGHGGHDAGATGRGGTREKDVTLAIARKLRAELEEAGLEVVLTREGDEHVDLAERTRLANDRHGDLFVSIHCNANHSRKLRGVETYTLNLNSDRYAARLAARENAGSRKGIGELQMILADLATKANTDDSVRLARLVQSRIVGNLRAAHGQEIRDLGVKQALFHVLVGARMPSILVETSFLSNAQEEKLLASEAYQGRIAASIRQAVERFIADRERLARGEIPAAGGSGVF